MHPTSRLPLAARCKGLPLPGKNAGGLPLARLGAFWSCPLAGIAKRRATYCRTAACMGRHCSCDRRAPPPCIPRTLSDARDWLGLRIYDNVMQLVAAPGCERRGPTGRYFLHGSIAT